MLDGDFYYMEKLSVYIDSTIDDAYLNCIVSDVSVLRNDIVCDLYLKSFDQILY